MWIWPVAIHRHVMFSWESISYQIKTINNCAAREIFIFSANGYILAILYLNVHDGTHMDRHQQQNTHNQQQIKKKYLEKEKKNPRLYNNLLYRNSKKKTIKNRFNNMRMHTKEIMGMIISNRIKD